MLYWQLYFDSKETIVSLCAYRYDSSNKFWGRRVVVGWTAYPSQAPGFTPRFSSVPHLLCFLCCAVFCLSDLCLVYPIVHSLLPLWLFLAIISFRRNYNRSEWKTKTYYVKILILWLNSRLVLFFSIT
jgi:hypothetical protein